ncbi:MAG: hypothetical protein LBB94_01835 [Clostridiales bacterium]|nr:hypothetical protein [Clostridiales bacterium]
MNTFWVKACFTAESAAYKFSVRTDAAWHKAMLNKRILERRADISKSYKTLARRYYEMWAAEKVDFDEIDTICQSILDKENQINAIKLEIHELSRNGQVKIDTWEGRKKREKPVLYNVVKREPELRSDDVCEPELNVETSGFSETEALDTHPENAMNNREHIKVE